jgi:hypothetical protein
MVRFAVIISRPLMHLGVAICAITVPLFSSVLAEFSSVRFRLQLGCHFKDRRRCSTPWIYPQFVLQFKYLVRCGHFHAGILEERREAAHRLLLAVNQERALRISCLPVPC